MTTISNNADFLFLYEASQCNPNGDPDQENKPRMDYDTDTNLVTDTRLKRYIRDYFKIIGRDIFVDMEEEKKVSGESKLEAVLTRLFSENLNIDTVFENNDALIRKFNEAREGHSDQLTLLEYLKGPKKSNKHTPPHPEVNYALLRYLVKQKFIDVRLFGSAFAIGGFTKAYTGPVQINWGYSLHKVQLMESSSIVTIMNDDSSTFGKDYRVHYSLLAFNGTINKYAAQSTGLTPDDIITFRDAIWNSIPSLPTRSKLNQYPKLYVEIIYNDGHFNGHFGDLRNYIVAEPEEGLDEKGIRKFGDLRLNLSGLQALIAENEGPGKAVKEVYIRSTPDISVKA